MLTVGQAAKRLGLNEHTIRVWLSRGKLSYFKLGRAVRVSESEIERLLSEGFVAARGKQPEGSRAEVRAGV